MIIECHSLIYDKTLRVITIIDLTPPTLETNVFYERPEEDENKTD